MNIFGITFTQGARAAAATRHRAVRGRLSRDQQLADLRFQLGAILPHHRLQHVRLGQRAELTQLADQCAVLLTRHHRLALDEGPRQA